MKPTARHLLLLAEIFAWVYCLINTMEGPIRWILAGLNLEMLLYLRDVALVLGLLTAILYSYFARDWRILGILGIMGVGAVFWFFVGLSFNHQFTQCLFGMKSLLPLFAGVMIGSHFMQGPKFIRLTFLLWAVVAFGVCLSAVWDIPWQGLSYDIGDSSVEGQRQWVIDGQDRLGGFARSSGDAAVHVALLGLALVCATRRRSVRAFVLLATGAVIFLTTSRSPLIGYVLAVAAWLICVTPKLRRLNWVLLPIPLLAAIVTYLGTKIPAFVEFVLNIGGTGISSTNSFSARADNVWRDAIYLVKEQGSFMIGRGIGGIGAAQRHFEPEIYNPADSLFIYVLVTFGIVGSILIFGVFLLNWMAKLRNPEGVLFPIACCAFFYGTGMTLNAPEIGFLFFMFGATVFEQPLLRSIAPVNAPSARSLPQLAESA